MAPIVPKSTPSRLGNVMTLELDCRNVVNMSRDCRGVSVCYPAGIILSPELGCRLRLETDFISLLADLSMTAAGLHTVSAFFPQ